MSQRFPVRKLFALSWAVFRQNGYEMVRAHSRSTGPSSAKQLRQMMHQSQEDRNMVQEDWDRADDMIQLAKGLAIKSMEREVGLSKLEHQIVELVKDDYIAVDSTRVNAAAALPELLQTQQMNDRWYQIERGLTGSVHIGDPNLYNEVMLTVRPEYRQRVRNGYYGSSIFVAGVTPDGNVVKFYLYDSESQKVQIGEEVTVRGRVKRHDINQEGIRQTFLRQVYLTQDRDRPW